MKNLNRFNKKNRCFRSYSIHILFIGLILFFTSCTERTEPYSIIEISGAEYQVFNYSKSYLMPIYQPDSVNPTALLASIGDLFAIGEYIFIYNDTSSRNKFSFRSSDEAIYVNDKLYAIEIPKDDKMIPWFENLNARDYSTVQFINFSSKLPESYLPYLNKLAEVNPYAGLFYSGDFADLTEPLKIFKPRYIAGPTIHRSDYDKLSELTGLELLMVSITDSAIKVPLPALPSLKQIFVGELKKNVVVTNDLLANNSQIERVFIQKSGSLDLSILNPLKNLKELVISQPDSIINFDLINNHKNLEVLVLQVEEPDFIPALIRLPSLRWMSFYTYVTQEEFNSFINAHPDLEVIDLVQNDTIGSLKALSKLTKLYGLNITDTVTDIASIKALTNLKYLSLPEKFLSDSLNKAGIQKSLPNTRVVANIPFCLGTGWLLLLIPFVLIMRFFAKRKK
jgi:hypothetical protein